MRYLRWKKERKCHICQAPNPTRAKTVREAKLCTRELVDSVCVHVRVREPSKGQIVSPMPCSLLYLARFMAHSPLVPRIFSSLLFK